MTSSDERVRAAPRPARAAAAPKASPRDVYSRFIPREELSSFASWSFGDVSGAGAGRPAHETEAAVDPATRQAQELRAARQSG